MNILTLNQVKMLKSINLGYLSAVLNLSPAFQYKGHNTCPEAGQCKAYCLQYTGRNGMESAVNARDWKIKMFYDDRKQFMAMWRADLYALSRKAKRENLLPTCRPNGLSDIDFENECPEIFEEFPDIQFIDYTKRYVRLFKPLPENYHLTYSISERTPAGIIKKIYAETPYNCAAVFQAPVPTRYKFDNKIFAVVNGDESDLRHLDPRGAIVGLKYKNPMHNKKLKGKKLKSGFIILN